MGELLPKQEPPGHEIVTDSLRSQSFSRQERQRFRDLAEHGDILESAIADGTAVSDTVCRKP